MKLVSTGPGIGGCFTREVWHGRISLVEANLRWRHSPSSRILRKTRRVPRFKQACFKEAAFTDKWDGPEESLSGYKEIHRRKGNPLGIIPNELNFLGKKIDEAMGHQDTLEMMDYPESAVEPHLNLHDAFVCYETALEELATLLSSKSSKEEERLGDVMRDLMEADKILARSQNQLDEKIDGDSDNTDSRVSLKV